MVLFGLPPRFCRCCSCEAVGPSDGLPLPFRPLVAWSGVYVSHRGQRASGVEANAPIVAVLCHHRPLLLYRRLLRYWRLLQRWRVAGLRSMPLPAKEGHSSGLAAKERLYDGRVAESMRLGLYEGGMVVVWWRA